MGRFKAFFRGQAWRIAAWYILLIIVSMSLVTIYLTADIRHSYLKDLQDHLAVNARMIADESEQYFGQTPSRTDLEALAVRMDGLSGDRVTIIALDGTVLGDSQQDPSTMENHLTRPEVAAAIATGLGAATRFSDTLKKEMMYVAVAVKADNVTLGVARVALPTSQVARSIGKIRTTILLAALVVTALAIVIAILIARRTTRSVREVTKGARRLATGALDHVVEVRSSDEAGEMAVAFNRMAGSLRQMVSDLASEKDKLAAVLSTMSEGVLMLNADGMIDLANPAAETLLDSSLPSGRRLIELVRDFELHRILNESLKTGSMQRGEVQVRQRYLAVTATPMVAGVLGTALLVIHDITDLRRVDKTRREFVANVSHELRTPLTSIKAAVETLREGAIDDRPAAIDFMARIESETDRMAALVSDLLELSRLESGQMLPDAAPAGLSAIVGPVFQRLEGRARAKGLTLELDVPADLPPVTVDAGLIGQVTYNLLDNAIKFTPEGGHISLTAIRGDDRVVVALKDSGIGIAREHLTHVFERFYKVDKSRASGGTGLGLAIARHIVRAHGGELSVASEEGRGSTFTFDLPLTPQS